jgi:histidinol-phosphate phosphatase family protein
MIPQAVILSGGKGTRLAERLRLPDGTFLPKPLVRLGGIPLLERQIRHVAAFGARRITLLVNHQAETIRDFCSSLILPGVAIELFDDGEPRGTAGAVLQILDALDDEFVVMYGDTLLNVDMERFYAFHRTHAADMTLFVHPNDHPQDSDLLEVDARGRLIAIHPYPHPAGADFGNLVNAALYCMRKEALLPFRQKQAPLDFARDLFPLMLAQGQALAAYASPEYIKDAGTPQRLDRAEEDLRSGRFAAQTLRLPQRAVFLDRDGVINELRGFIATVDDFQLLPGVGQAVRRLNRAGFLAVVVTNQPVVARGECDESGLRAIHKRMETLLGLEGAYIDRLYYCPHHPDSGFPGERADLKGPCGCRKPATGMLEAARKDMNIDFAQSWFVGDSTMDVQCARNAGIRSLLVHTGEGGRDGRYRVAPAGEAEDLGAAVEHILSEKRNGGQAA